MRRERYEKLCIIGMEMMIERGLGNEFAELGGVKTEMQRTENRT